LQQRAAVFSHSEPLVPVEWQHLFKKENILDLSPQDLAINKKYAKIL
jgi:hypothetical protein